MPKIPCKPCTRKKVKDRSKPVYMIYDDTTEMFTCLQCGNAVSAKDVATHRISRARIDNDVEGY